MLLCFLTLNVATFCPKLMVETQYLKSLDTELSVQRNYPSHIVIVGGGTAGWMTAAALIRTVCARDTSVTLVESNDIGSVGVGEATIPPIRTFNRMLGLDEAEFVRETGATFKLGIEFVGWKNPGHSYFHPFGRIGEDIDSVAFSHFWLRARLEGEVPPVECFSLEARAALAGRFAAEAKRRSSRLNYAYHFDAGLYAAYLKRWSQVRGVRRVEGRVAAVRRDGKSGDIRSIRLSNGQAIVGNFFIDCSGFRGLLIEDVLKAGFEDWSEWLPANRAVAAPSTRLERLTPYTRATAQPVGWRWRIPLQHRTGNGHVFDINYFSEQRAIDGLVEDLGSSLTADPKVLRFTTGRRRRHWIGNCVAIGLSAGFLEPLESTSIHLIQAAIVRLLALLPNDPPAKARVDRFNNEMSALYSEIRDFLIAHYAFNDRRREPFWRRCRSIAFPESLMEKLAFYRREGEMTSRHQDLFKHPNWFAVLTGQGCYPASYHPAADRLPSVELRARIGYSAASIANQLGELHTQEAYLRLHGMTRP